MLKFKKYLSPTQKAWLAGFIDGEGFIGITFQRKKENKQQSSTPRYHPYLIVANNFKESISYIMDLIGHGQVYQLSKKNRLHSPSFQYKLSEAPRANPPAGGPRLLCLFKKSCSLKMELPPERNLNLSIRGLIAHGFPIRD